MTLAESAYGIGFDEHGLQQLTGKAPNRSGFTTSCWLTIVAIEVWAVNLFLEKNLVRVL